MSELIRFGFARGDEVKHINTPFKGIVVGQHVWQNGCIRYTVQAEGLHEGKPVDGVAFDEQELKLIKRAKVEVMPMLARQVIAAPEAISAGSGGPNRPASRGHSASRR